MDVFVKTQTSTFTFTIESAEKVSVLCEMIAGKSGVAPADQRIIYGGRELQKDMALRDYGVEKETTLHMYTSGSYNLDAEAGPGPGSDAAVDLASPGAAGGGDDDDKPSTQDKPWRNRENRKSRHGRHARRASAFDIHSHSAHGVCGEGYDPEIFVEPVPDALHCGICVQVCRYPVETDCGHIFCHCCILGWRDKNLENEESLTCPIDSEPLEIGNLRLAVRDLRVILGSKVNCPNKEQGCNASFELRALEEHSSQCEYRVETCTMCDEKVPAKELQQHNKINMPIHLKYAVMENEALRSELSTVTRALMSELAAVKRQLEEVKRAHEKRIVELEKPVEAKPTRTGADAGTPKKAAVRFG